MTEKELNRLRWLDKDIKLLKTNLDEMKNDDLFNLQVISVHAAKKMHLQEKLKFYLTELSMKELGLCNV